MPREGGWKQAGKPRTRYRSEAKPQKPSKQLRARIKSFNAPGNEGGLNGGASGFHKPGSQNPRK